MSRNTTRTPVVPADSLTGTNKTDAGDIDLSGQDRSIDLGMELTLEELRDSLNATISHDMNDPHFQKFAADSEFMNGQVLVRVSTSSNKDDEKIVAVFNNGVPQRFIRGEWTIVRRKYVEVLARSKPFGVTTPEVVDANGDRTTRIDTHVGLLYPFEMRDQDPRGQGWLQRILQEA